MAALLVLTIPDVIGSTVDANATPSNMRFTATIPDYTIEVIQGKSTVVYNIHMATLADQEWVVRRRYSEFRDNYLAIKREFPNSRIAQFPFPRKMVFNSEKHAEERKEILSMYLVELLTLSPPPKEVQIFLRIAHLLAHHPEILSLHSNVAHAHGGQHGHDGSEGSEQHHVVRPPTKNVHAPVGADGKRECIYLTKAAVMMCTF